MNIISYEKNYGCHYPVSELLRQEGLEDCEQHVEYVGLVHNVVTFEPKWNAILKQKDRIFTYTVTTVAAEKH
jgi:hypothetical protein